MGTVTDHKCFGIAGWKNSGKTTLVSEIVRNLSNRGLRISTMKHAHHAFDLDQEGTDSFKHREAGASEVLLVSENRWAIQHELREADEPPFDEMLRKLNACDLVIVEGYKRENIPKLEIIGDLKTAKQLWPTNENVKAIACDTPVEGCTLPQFTRSQISDIADFILKFHGIQA